MLRRKGGLRTDFPTIPRPCDNPARPRPGVAPRGYGPRMRYYTPVIDLTGRSAERIGGVPAGLWLPEWPGCAGCGRPMSFLAQFAHHPERLDLGGTDRFLTLWQCEREETLGTCPTFRSDGGANAALVVPMREGGADRVPEDAPPIYPTRPIVGWAVADDGVDPADMAVYLDGAAYFARMADRSDPGPDAVYGSRLGGAPSWIQSPAEAPAGWRFVGQFEDGMDVPGQPAPLMADGAGPGPNFGTGVAYVFLDPAGDPPAAKMFWQC